MKSVKIKDDFIKLGQALKLAGLVNEGVEAKYAVIEGKVLVNDEVCTMRGKKLYSGDKVSYNGDSFIIE